MYNLIIIFYLILLTNSQKVRNASRTDLMKCKLTKTGMEYRGTIAKTAGSVRCQSWYTEEPVHEINKDIGDKDFPEKSMKAAKNYCRNPTGDGRGPWCYTMDRMLIDDECDVPLCNFGECRLSGPGSEYGGTKEITATGNKCKSWAKRYQLQDSKSMKFTEKDFPDRSRKKAENFCRNPSGDVGGPWCYVDEENFEFVQKQYCDIPFCDDKDCLTFTRNTSDYTVLTKIYGDSGNISFWTKLWNPDDEKKGIVPRERLTYYVVEDPWPPNCVSDVKDYQFVGSQWTSHNEVPCVPWISKEVPGEEKNDEKFVDGSALKALNKCRNPTHDPDGPYCYGYTPWQTETVTKRYCTIRPCRSSECKMAGTANDYVGKLSKTRSGRVCDKWPLSSEEMASKLTPPKPTAPKPARSAFMSPTFETIHENQLQRYFYGPHYFAFPTPVEHMKARSVPWKPKGIGGSKQISGRETFNSSMYPEGSATNASNYCRNPSRNIAGSWCYTTDPLLPRDLCNVKDCEKP
ncbi:plasminogen-like, partial [Ceratina calcarata]|uniref:Plasminogen-like n=1 Tax=Ceratina calcarata TaxID=156304 RepID=A0AAJ7N8P8_9HYME